MSTPQQTPTVQAKRRSIIRAMLGASLGAVFAPMLYAIGRYLGFRNSSGAKDALIESWEISGENPSKLIEINDEPVLVIYQADKGVRAFDAKCTHLGCTVTYQPQVPGFYCKCHHGRYDADGVNVPGTRPKSPLTELTIIEKDGKLDITLIPKKKA